MLYNEPSVIKIRLFINPLVITMQKEYIISYQQMDLSLTLTEDNTTKNFK